MTFLWAAVVWLFCAMPAHAHGGLVAGPWSYDPWVIVPLYLSGILYLVGTSRLWRKAGFGRGVTKARSASFWCGWTCLALALVSPLHWLGERLFSAHMIEHGLIIAVAAPLIALARPTAAMLWAFPSSARYRLGWLLRWTPAVALSSALASPVMATAVHAIALWLWHLPAAYDLAVANVTAHRLQHASFGLTGLIFWWALLRHRSNGLAMLCLFISAMHTGLLGFVLTVSPRLLYPPQTALAGEFGLTPLEDQQLAGLIMWVPMGVVYSAAALYFASRWIKESSRFTDARSNLRIAAG